MRLSTIEYDFVLKDIRTWFYLDRRTREHVFERHENRRTCFFIKTREHENKRTLSGATISHEICQHSAHFLPTFVQIHKFCSTYVCAKDRESIGTMGWCMSFETCESKSATFSSPRPSFGVNVSAMPPCPLLFIIIPLLPNQNQ